MRETAISEDRAKIVIPRLPLALLLAALLAGCGNFPQFEAAVGDDRVKPGYLPLLPVEDLRAAAAPRPGRAGATLLTANAAAPSAVIEARAARLRARAAQLGTTPVIDESTRKRLDEEITIDEAPDDSGN